MTITYSKDFIKQAERLQPKLQIKLYENILLYQKDPFNPRLRNHQLKGKYKQYRSIDVTGDYRALYLQSGNEVIFDIVGTHSQLYS